MNTISKYLITTTLVVLVFVSGREILNKNHTNVKSLNEAMLQAQNDAAAMMSAKNKKYGENVKIMTLAENATWNKAKENASNTGETVADKSTELWRDTEKAAQDAWKDTKDGAENAWKNTKEISKDGWDTTKKALNPDTPNTTD